jgi:predicted Zn-dependent protease
VLYESDWDWRGAEREFQRALAVDPNSAHTIRNYAQYLEATQHFEQAMDEYQRAEKIDPDPVDTDSNTCMLLEITRNYAPAIAQCRKLLDESPDNSMALYFLAASYVYSGSYPEALAVAKRGGDSPMFQSEVAIIYARTGNRAAAQRILSDLEADRARNPVSDYALAEVYSELGDSATALKLLRHSYLDHAPEMVFFAEDQDFDNLRDMPEFQQILSDVGLPASPVGAVSLAQLPHPASAAPRGK